MRRVTFTEPGRAVLRGPGRGWVRVRGGVGATHECARAGAKV